MSDKEGRQYQLIRRSVEQKPKELIENAEISLQWRSYEYITKQVADGVTLLRSLKKRVDSDDEYSDNDEDVSTKAKVRADDVVDMYKVFLECWARIQTVNVSEWTKEEPQDWRRARMHIENATITLSSWIVATTPNSMGNDKVTQFRQDAQGNKKGVHGNP